MTLPKRATGSTYDGINKVNYASIPPANQTIDWDNPSLGSCVCDVAELGLPAARFWMRLTLAASTGGLSVLNWQAMWSNVTTTQPVPTRTSTGIFAVTLPTFVSNEYDASFGVTNNVPLILNGASANLEDAVFGFINAKASGNVITIHTADTSGTASDLAGSVLFIKAY